MLLAAFVQHDLMKTDDECVGEALIPLAGLMDQQDHSLLVTLRTPARPPTPASPGRAAKPATAKRNRHGGLGVLTVKCMCTER